MGCPITSFFELGKKIKSTRMAKHFVFIIVRKKNQKSEFTYLYDAIPIVSKDSFPMVNVNTFAGQQMFCLALSRASESSGSSVLSPLLAHNR